MKRITQDPRVRLIIQRAIESARYVEGGLTDVKLNEIIDRTLESLAVVLLINNADAGAEDEAEKGV